MPTQRGDAAHHEEPGHRDPRDARDPGGQLLRQPEREADLRRRGGRRRAGRVTAEYVAQSANADACTKEARLPGLPVAHDRQHGEPGRADHRQRRQGDIERPVLDDDVETPGRCTAAASGPAGHRPSRAAPRRVERATAWARRRRQLHRAGTTCCMEPMIFPVPLRPGGLETGAVARTRPAGALPDEFLPGKARAGRRPSAVRLSPRSAQTLP